MIEKPAPYIPSFIKNIIEGSRPTQLNFEAASKLTNTESTASFFYDSPGQGMKSTQQLNLDWSKFENHTFFSSAEVNVNVAFDNIINTFPFDGSKKELEKFLEKLTGFEKYVYDSFPKNIGYLNFSGTQAGEDTDGTKGTFIKVQDYAGSLYPELSKLKTGQNILNPRDKSFSIEMQLYLPSQANNIQTVCQKLSGTTQGFSFFIPSASSQTVVNGIFALVSGAAYLTASIPITKGQFNHLCFTYNRDERFQTIQIFKDSRLVSESEKIGSLGEIEFKVSPFLIGSGTAITIGTGSITPVQTLSGAMDELRFFHSIRTQEQQKRYAKKAIFADEDLKLYYKFNEPSGTLGPNESESVNRVVLDSSGNSLHSLISDAAADFPLRSTGSIENPMTYERLDLSPVLFAYYSDVVTLNTELLLSATAYDDVNPNIISRLIPQHYLLEGQVFDALDTFKGFIGDQYTSENIPGSGKLGSAQLILSFLYIWAKFFDEIKLNLDAFSKINYVDYDANESTPDSLLPYLFKWMGVTVPPLFLDASIEQYIDAENIEFSISRGAEPLKSIQHQFLRRVLISLKEIIKSKGTLRSVKSFMRTMGFDPDNSFKIREFGGPTSRPLSFARENKVEPHQMIAMSASYSMVSPYLTASRKEVGFPYIQGQMVQSNVYTPHGISNNTNDGLLTSGSWTYEGVYKFSSNKKLTSVSQSLARMHVTGTNTASGGLLFNLIAISSSQESNLSNLPGRIVLFGRPTSGDSLSSSPLIEMNVAADIFDGKKWNISFGRQRGDEERKSFVSSSYFLRVGRQENGVLRERYVTSSWIAELGTAGSASMSALQQIQTFHNTSGSFLSFGTQTIPSGTTSGYRYLNNTSLITESVARHTLFEGNLAQARFWSKALTDVEWDEHVKNYKSLGVLDPTTNFNFAIGNTGSFNRLRLDVSMNQPDKVTDSSGNITLFDYSQNNLHLAGTGFPTSSNPFHVDLFSYNTISPYFDEAATTEKIRVRSYLDSAKVTSSSFAENYPVYRINPSEQPSDDTRFTIEFSLVDALNRDMVNIFATLDVLDNMIGNPELVFSSDYPGLENLRNIYFNRLTEKMNFKSFFEFFRWFETSVGSFIEHLIPRKTKYFGTNFVIESHMLERAKIQYLNNEIYLTAQERSPFSDTLLLQLLVGTLKRY